MHVAFLFLQPSAQSRSSSPLRCDGLSPGPNRKLVGRAQPSLTSLASEVESNGGGWRKDTATGTTEQLNNGNFSRIDHQLSRTPVSASSYASLEEYTAV